MVTRHSYSIYCTSPTITIRNTETPLPSLLVTSWRRVGHPKMRSLFGKDVTLPRSSSIQSPNEDKISSPSVRKSVTRNRKTPGSHLCPSIVFRTRMQTHSSTQKRPQTWNFGPASKGGPFVRSAPNKNLESCSRHSAEGLPPHCTILASAATAPMSSLT